MTRLSNKRRMDAIIAKRQAKRLPLPWMTAEPVKTSSLPLIQKPLVQSNQTVTANNANNTAQ